jgi:predicted aspartyl protease
MQISGRWLLCADGIQRPIIEGTARTAEGRWEPVPFLVDTGADQTALNADLLELLDLPSIGTSFRLEGLGGHISLEVVETTIHLFREQGEAVSFYGQFAAVRDPDALEMSVLGRDILDLFAVIVDRPGDAVCLVGQRHRYQILPG